MSITAARPINLTNLGVRGIIPGDPDGFFQGDEAITGDASGGISTFSFFYGDVTNIESKPTDVLFRLNWLRVVNNHSAAIPNLEVSFFKTVPWNGTAERGLHRVTTLASRNSTDLDFRGGLWVLSQKRDGEFVRLTHDNVNTAVVHIVFQGYYWYMGRLRLREAEQRG